MPAAGKIVVPGFRGGGLWCGIRKNGKPDLAIVISDRPCTSAVLFTRNRVAAAPVEWGRALRSRSALRGVIANSGNANACTGKDGLSAVRRISAKACGTLGLPDGSLLVSSTGVIGVPLPAGKILGAVPRLCASLSPGGIPRANDAILTTDAYPKRAVRRFRVRGGTVTLGGIAKGAGMIAPGMGTMLAYVFTDAAVRAADLRKAFRGAVGLSFNRIVVDGDMSTNDTAAIFANGACGLPPLAGEDLAGFAGALRELLLDLALMIVRDGEGATRVVRILVAGARNDRDAESAARAVATSPLVKTAVFGADLNWGRVIAAVGRSGAAVDPARVEVSFAGEKVMLRGMKIDRRAERRAEPKIRKEAYGIDVNLGLGKGSYFVFFSDLGHDYVRINAGYRT
ncbi:MAG: bifunctional glutamate N-acetyltransferase/amino-acid acetyltransferase ArgJ [Candidatus Deferrimicrobiaceae bacterium]